MVTGQAHGAGLESAGLGVVREVKSEPGSNKAEAREKGETRGRQPEATQEACASRDLSCPQPDPHRHPPMDA